MPPLNAAYSLDPKTVHGVIEAIRTGKPYDEKQFECYHLYRNVFNVGAEVKTLKRVVSRGTENTSAKYKDNLGYIWTEAPLKKNAFHMPLGKYIGARIWGTGKPYSRKFLRDDPGIIKGEFEMIIRYDGKRIDAITNKKYQETYNFARTRNATLHAKLDVKPHFLIFEDYKVRKDTGSVKIIE